MYSQIKWNDFPRLSKKDELVSYFEGRELTHTSYFHYTRTPSANSIIENQELWLSSVAGFNDTKDSDQFKETERNCYYSLCFSTGASENLPLWYLYSGIDGRGVRIEFSRPVIKKLLDNGQFFLVEIDGAKQSRRDIMQLEQGKTATFMFHDVLYSQKNGDGLTYRLKYNTMTNNRFPAHEYMAYSKEIVGFQKSLIWFYEKETRLLVHLTGEAAKAVASPEKHIVVLRFRDDVINKMKLMFAPNVKKAEVESILQRNGALLRFRNGTSRVGCSDYSGTVDFRLFRECEKEGNCPLREGNVTD